MGYRKNLSYLATYNETLVKQLDEVSAEEMELAEVDGFVYKMTDDQGKDCYSGSIYDPEQEAEIFLDQVNMDNTGFLVLGLNSGWLLRKLLERKTDTAWVILIEKDLRVVRRFLEETDLSEFMEDKPQRLIIISGSEEDMKLSFTEYLYSLIGFYFLQAEILRTFPTYRRHRTFYDELQGMAKDLMVNFLANMGNSLDDTLMGISNELKNIPFILTAPRLKDFQNSYLGKPIICVASGPSLDKQLALLKQVKGKALILCAESSFKALLKNGIVPDIVAVLERGENSYTLSMSGIEIPEETAFFGLTVADSRIFTSWPKYAVPCFKKNLGNSQFFNQALGDFGEIPSGSSVAHFNFMLAKYLGGDPIVFVGQDLAYSEDGVAHSEHTDYSTFEQRADEIEEAARDAHSRTVWLEGYYGGKVRSRELWREFKDWMERLIFFFGENTTILNATEGGAKIQGTRNMPFREVIAQYCVEPLAAIGETISRLPVRGSDAASLAHGLRSAVVDLLEEVRTIRDTADRNWHFIQNFLPEIAGSELVFLETKAQAILERNEDLIQTIMAHSLLQFYFNPLVVHLHVKINPISRISSMERLQTILREHGEFLYHVRNCADKFTRTFVDGMAPITELYDLEPISRMEGVGSR